MVKTYKIQINKANGQPFVNLSKKDGWKEGDEIIPQIKWGGIYNKTMLEKYYEENKDSLSELKEEALKLHKETFSSKEYKFITETIPEKLGLGKMTCDYEEPYLFSNNDFSMELYGDIDGGTIGDMSYNLKEYLEMIENNEYNLKDKYLEEIKQVSYIKFIQKAYEYICDRYEIKLNKLFSEYNFEPTENNDEFEDVFTNGKIFIKYSMKNLNSLEITDLHNENSIDL